MTRSDEDLPRLDYGRPDPRQIEPWQPTRAAAIALLVLGALLAAFTLMVVVLTWRGAFDD